MKKLLSKNRIILLLVLFTVFMLAVPRRTEAAAKYPFKYFKIGGKNIVRKINDIFDPAYFFDGIMEIEDIKTLKKGAKISWKLNKGWHAKVSYNWNKKLKSGRRLSRFDTQNDGIGIYVWKGKKRNRRTYREEYYIVYYTNFDYDDYDYDDDGYDDY